MRPLTQILIESAVESVTGDGSIETSYVTRHRISGEVTGKQARDGSKSRNIKIWKTRQLSDLTSQDTVKIGGQRFSIVGINEGDSIHSKTIDLEIAQQ